MTVAAPARRPARASRRQPGASESQRVGMLLWSIVGSYLVADLTAGWVARLLVSVAHLQNGEAMILTSMLAIVACSALVVWAFAHRSPLRASIVLLVWVAIGFALDWFVGAIQ